MTESNGIAEIATPCSHEEDPHREHAFLWLKTADQRIVSCLCLLGFVILLGYNSNSFRGIEESQTTNNETHRFDYRLDLNSASENRLMLLSGIGPALSHRIVEDRKEHGPFETIDDLLRVKGIGPKKLHAIMPYITVIKG